MKKVVISWGGPVLAAGILFALSVFAQQPEFKYELKGLIRDKDDLVIPGLPLSINGEAVSDTDLNGEFLIPVPEGHLFLSSSLLDVNNFRVFLKTGAKELNPGYLEFVVDSASITCGKDNGKAFPKITKSVVPKYYAAAVAIRAKGEVLVDLKIDDKGNYVSAEALSGPPLLRSISIVAAREFKFEPATESKERNVKLTFIFLLDQTEKAGLKRYECPYRIIVPYIPQPIDIADTKTWR
jgi:hypothetical protein